MILFHRKAAIGMKGNTRTTIWFLVFIWFIFMGVTFVSFGLGALYPPINRIAQPFVCPNGLLSYIENTSNPMPGTTITQIGWYCVDSASGARTKMGLGPLHLYAGALYGLLMFVAASTIWYYYNKGIGWVKKMVSIMGVVAIVLLVLFPMMPLFGSLFPRSKPIPDAAAASIERTYQKLTSKTTSDFSSLDKPLADWNGVPIMPKAIAGQETNNDTYTFKVPVDSGTIELYYSDKLKALGWSLSDRRWQGMKFTKDKIVLLVTLAPAADLQSWVVTLVRIP
jgi:hypothetical protein